MRSHRVWLVALALTSVCCARRLRRVRTGPASVHAAHAADERGGPGASCRRRRSPARGPWAATTRPPSCTACGTPRAGRRCARSAVSNRETGAPASTDQTFRIASITKTFTATAVLLLVDDGRVRLDAPVARVRRPACVDPLPGGRSATVRRLLNMTSGFPDYGGRGDGPFTTAALTPQRVWTPGAGRARRGPLRARRAGRVRLLEHELRGPRAARRTRVGDVVRHVRAAADPAAARPEPHAHPIAGAHAAGRDARLPDASWGSAGRGSGRRRAGRPRRPARPPAASRRSSDLARWAAADFGDALLELAPRAARLRRVSSDHLLRGSAYGLGLQIEQGWHFHVGELFGWETLAMASPRTGRVVVVVRNACCGSVFENYLLAREAMPALAPVVDPVYRR